jgi:Na+-driven multidrug efflux pump
VPYNLFRFSRPDFEIIRHTLGLSIFIMFQYLISLGGWFVFFMFVEKLGERQLAASNIIRSLYIALMIPAWALGSAVNTLVSNSLGQNKPERVLPTIRKVSLLSLLIVGFFIMTGILFARPLISVYTSDVLLVDATIPVFYVIAGAIFLFSFASILFNGVLGTANTNMGFFIEAVTIIFYLFTAWLLAIKLQRQVQVVWMAEYVYMIIMGGLSFLYLESGKWKGKKI